MDFDPGKVMVWFSLLNGVATVVLGITVWLRKPGEDASKAVEQLRGEVAKQTQEFTTRLTAVEAHMAHMPSDEELAKLEGTVKQIDERTEGLAEAVSTIRTTLNRIENFLLNTK